MQMTLKEMCNLDNRIPSEARLLQKHRSLSVDVRVVFHQIRGSVTQDIRASLASRDNTCRTDRVHEIYGE